MSPSLQRIIATRRTGDEPLHADGRPVGGTLLDFWRWSASDLLSNATRGRLAEYLVARAICGIEKQIRDEWDAFDLTTPEGTRVEVKSAAYIQSWFQKRESFVTFRVPKTRAWSSETNQQELEPKRQAQVYIFALLHHLDSPDPLNVNHWTFYVLPTTVLNNRTRSQHSITLASLKKVCAAPVAYDQLAEAVSAAARAV